MLKMSAGTMVGREATTLLSQIESEVALDRLFRLFSARDESAHP